MLRELTVSGYRKFKTFSLKGFQRFNFFVGDNNVGKTSILESIFGWSCGFNLQPFAMTAIARNYTLNVVSPYILLEFIAAAVHDTDDRPWNFNFSGRSDEGTCSFSHIITPAELMIDTHNSFQKPNAVIAAQWEIQSENEKKIKNIGIPFFIPSESPAYLGKYIDILGHRDQIETIRMYSALKREGKMDAFLQDLQAIFPEIEAIDTLPYPDATQAPISLKVKGGRFLPLFTFGDGLQRWYYILGALLLYKKGIFCIDEIDAILHPAAQAGFCRNLMTYARKYDAQLFMTTHNLEFLDTFLSTWQELGETDDLRVITLKQFAKTSLRTRNLSGKEALDLRLYNMELR